LEDANEGLEILVGVAGLTKSGKSSLLNALLEYPGLLPSNSTQVATTTACRISWNFDNIEGHEFRAEVNLRSKEDVLGELTDFLTAVADRKRIRDKQFDDEDEHLQAIEDVNEIISKDIHKVCAIWDLDMVELDYYDYTVESVLAKRNYIANLLGQPIKVYSSTVHEFSAKVKPYLTPTQTAQFTAWPLIKESMLKLKSLSTELF
jgi:hypothetical protein